MMVDALLVAGGQGLRMGGPIPKQFIELNGVPIIVHTIRQFLSFDASIRLLVVLPKDHLTHWNSIRDRHLSEVRVTVAIGGKTRTESVQNGLSTLSADSQLVAIHDAVRPFVPIEVIAASFESAKEFGSGVASVALKDSIRKLTGQGSQAVDRNQYRLVQTPQTFQTSVIKQAYKLLEGKTFSDDASVLESTGHQIHLIEGAYENIKITTPEDLPSQA